MKFKRPTDALLYWWDVLRSGGIPLAPTVYEDEDEHYTRVQVSRKAWTPSNALCSYIDIGKAISRLSLRDQRIIKGYLLHIVGANGDGGIIRFNQWKYKNNWRLVMKRFWKQIPKEYKYGLYRERRGTSTHGQGSSLVSQGEYQSSVVAYQVGQAQGF